MAKNRVILGNPYGMLGVDVLLEFERELNTSLPTEYREYLLTHNGGDFEKRVVLVPDEGHTRVHHMFGLHEGPEYRRLRKQRLLFGGGIARDYLPICDDGVGNTFFLKLKGRNQGAVYFGDHEAIGGDKRVEHLQFVSGNFKEFVESMLSDDEMLEGFKQADPDGYSSFQQLLEEMQELRRKEEKGQ